MSKEHRFGKIPDEQMDEAQHNVLHPGWHDPSSLKRAVDRAVSAGTSEKMKEQIADAQKNLFAEIKQRSVLKILASAERSEEVYAWIDDIRDMMHVLTTQHVPSDSDVTLVKMASEYLGQLITAYRELRDEKIPVYEHANKWENIHDKASVWIDIHDPQKVKKRMAPPEDFDPDTFWGEDE